MIPDGRTLVLVCLVHECTWKYYSQFHHSFRGRCKDENQKERIWFLMLCSKFLEFCALLLFYFKFLRYHTLFLLYIACSITALGARLVYFPFFFFSFKMSWVLRKFKVHNEATFKYINALACVFCFSLKCTIQLFCCFKENVLVVPADTYSYKILDKKTVDKSFDFINQCGGNSFYIE